MEDETGGTESFRFWKLEWSSARQSRKRYPQDSATWPLFSANKPCVLEFLHLSQATGMGPSTWIRCPQGTHQYPRWEEQHRPAKAVAAHSGTLGSSREASAQCRTRKEEILYCLNRKNKTLLATAWKTFFNSHRSHGMSMLFLDSRQQPGRWQLAGTAEGCCTGEM